MYKSSGQIIALHYTRTEQKQEIRRRGEKKKKKKRKHRRLFTTSSLEQKLAATASNGCHTLLIYTRPPRQPPVEEGGCRPDTRVALAPCNSLKRRSKCSRADRFIHPQALVFYTPQLQRGGGDS